MLLDEPSAALDAESEALIFEALERLMARKTSITIAHRLTTVRRAQMIYVIDHGTISARGSHDHLLANSPLYARLHQLQFQGEPVVSDVTSLRR